MVDVGLGRYGSCPAPYGWVNAGNTIRHHVDEWPVVEKIMRLRIKEGLTLIEIAEILNRSGVKTRRGKAWTKWRVRDVMSFIHIHTNKAFHLGRHMRPTLVVSTGGVEHEQEHY